MPGPVKCAKMTVEDVEPVRSEPLPGAWPGAWVIGDEEVRAVTEVLRAKSPFRHYGPNVLGRTREFEKAFAARMGTRFALGVTSGTAALIVALRGIEVGPEDEVIMPAYTFVACPCAVAVLGGVPVMAEIDETLTLDPADVERRITPHTKAIMVVHTGGVAADMDGITSVAKKHSLKVLEDCAQSCGASFRGSPIGSIGDVAAFSFQINKIITTGDGGVVTTSDADIYERAVRYHDLGSVRAQFEIEPRGAASFGNNYRMSELTGAMALVQLGKLDAIVDAMRKVKAGIVEGTENLPGLELRRIPDPAGDAAATLTFFAPGSEAADRVIAALQAENVSCGKPYGGRALYETWPDHFENWLAERRSRGARELAQSYQSGLCPRTEALLRRTISISLTPILTDEDVTGVVAGIRKAWRPQG